LSERDLEYRRDVTFEELALYGELTYNISDTLRVTGGLRWFDNKSVNDTILGFPLVAGATSPEVPRSEDKDSDVLMKFNISWDMSESTMLYGTYSEGYRRGGANAVPSLDNGDPFGEPNAEAIRSYSKDTVSNYEIGIKGQTDRLSYTVSAFYVDWQDPQLNTTTAWWSFYVADNGDEASTQGIEVELNGVITNNLGYRLGYAYVKAELEQDFISTQTDTVRAPSGSTLPGTPEHVFSGSLDHSWEFSADMALVSRLSAYYQSEAENFINSSSPLNQTHEEFWLWNGSIAVVSQNWDLTFYGKNLADEDGVTGAFPSSYFGTDTGTFEGWYGNGNRQFITQPRTIGLSASYHF
jgi:iron complex outermembrane receptor protein